MADTVNLPGARLAGLSIDLLAKLKGGNLTLDELAAFLKRQNPFPKDRRSSLGAARSLFEYRGATTLSGTRVRGCSFPQAPRDTLAPLELLRSPRGVMVNPEFREQLWDRFKPELTAPRELPKRCYMAVGLRREANDAIIRSCLPEPHYSSLEDIHHLFSLQPMGEEGFLAVDVGKEPRCPANIFYVMAENGEVFTLRARWANGANSWSVSGTSPETPDKMWYKTGEQVVYRI